MLLLYVGGRFGASQPAAMTRAVAGKTGRTVGQGTPVGFVETERLAVRPSS